MCSADSILWAQADAGANKTFSAGTHALKRTVQDLSKTLQGTTANLTQRRQQLRALSDHITGLEVAIQVRVASAHVSREPCTLAIFRPHCEWQLG